MIWQVRQAVSLPLIGMGGITSAADAVEFLIAGADAVAVGTGLFVNPRLPVEVVAGIKAYLDGHGFASVRELSGSLELPE